MTALCVTAIYSGVLLLTALYCMLWRLVKVTTHCAATHSRVRTIRSPIQPLGTMPSNWATINILKRIYTLCIVVSNLTNLHSHSLDLQLWSRPKSQDLQSRLYCYSVMVSFLCRDVCFQNGTLVWDRLQLHLLVPSHLLNHWLTSLCCRSVPQICVLVRYRHWWSPWMGKTEIASITLKGTRCWIHCCNNV